jgi:hypothetical protein
MTVQAIANLLFMLLEYACIPLAILSAKYAQHHDVGSLGLGIFLMGTYGLVLLQYAFSIQSAYLAKQILAELRPDQVKGPKVIRVYVITFAISFIFWAVSFDLFAKI